MDTMSETYRKIQRLVDELTDEEVVALLKYVQEIARAREHMANYDPSKDPYLTGEALFKGPSDLSERVEEMRYIEIMQSDTLPDDYDPDNDPSVGFISGPTDLAARTKEILWSEFGLRKSESSDEESTT